MSILGPYAELPEEEPPAAEEELLRLLLFRIGRELHACDVLLVEEVVTDAAVHPLPDLPRPVLGVIRLRGALVPVLDVSAALGVRLAEARTPAVLILDAGERRIGIAADEVREVASLPASALQRAPAGQSGQDEHVVGVARTGDDLVTVLDLEKVLGNYTLSTRGSS